jgi:hypothetical protein
MSTSNFLGGVFGQMPSYMGGLLSPEEQEKLKQEAQNQGVLNLGLSLLAGSGRSPVRRTTGELVAQGLQAGQQAYRGATQQAIQDKMLGLQFAEMARKQKAMEIAREQLPKLVQTTEIPGAQIPLPHPMDDEGNVYPEARMPSQITRAINPQSAAALRQVLDPKQYADLIKAAETEIGINAPKHERVGNRVIAINPDGTVKVLYQGPQNLEFRAVGDTVFGLNPETGAKVTEFNAESSPLPPAAKVYARVYFPGVAYTSLTPEQIAQAMNWAQMASPADVATLEQKNVELQATVGVRGPSVPQRPLLAPPAAAPQATQQVAPQVAPQATRQAQPAPQPVAQPAPTQAAPQQALQAPVSGEPAYTQSTVDNPTVVNPAIPLKTRNEFKSKQPQAMSATVSMLRTYRDTQNDIRNLINNDAGLRAASGFGGELVSAVPGTQAANAKAILDKLKNRSFVANINEMRAASPTGAAVGAVTEREGARFENLIASLSQAQTYDQLKRQLVELDNFLLETSGATKNAYEQDFGRNQTINSVFSQMPKALTQQQVTPGDLGSAARQELERRKQRK